MPRAKRKATPPPALAREAFLKKGGKEADLMQEALKKVEALQLGKRTTEEVDKIATDYGLQSKPICKAWDATCKKQERRGGDPRSVLEVDENAELVRIVLESQYTADLFNPVIQGIEIRAIAADFLATRGIILPYINGLPNENWLERWRNRNPRLKGAKTMYTEEWEPLVIPRKRRASSYESSPDAKKIKTWWTGEELDELDLQRNADEIDITDDESEDDNDEEEEEGETEDEEDALDNEYNGKYMRFVNLEPGEGEYIRHPECRLTKKGAIEFGIPPWLLYMYE